MSKAPKKRRFNFFIEQKWIDRMNRDKAKYGHTTVAGLLRFIVISFFENKNKP